MTLEERIKDVQDGDMLVVAGKTFLSRSIIFFMKQYQKRFPISPEVLKFLNGFVGSHAGILFWVRGVLYVYESVVKGYKPDEFLKVYGPNDSFLVVRVKGGYYDYEKDQAMRYAQELVSVSLTYAYWDLAFWIVYIFTRFSLTIKINSHSFTIKYNGFSWPLRWGGRMADYCYETSYRIRNRIRPKDYTKNPLVISFFELFLGNELLVINNIH
jgi:hypothetical protein